MLNLIELILLAFAAARGTQLIVHDSILDGARVALGKWHAAKIDSKVRAFVMTLLGCIYCTGFHMAWITTTVYLTVMGRWDWSLWLVHGIQFFAVAGMQAL